MVSLAMDPGSLCSTSREPMCFDVLCIAYANINIFFFIHCSLYLLISTRGRTCVNAAITQLDTVPLVFNTYANRCVCMPHAFAWAQQISNKTIQKLFGTFVHQHVAMHRQLPQRSVVSSALVPGYSGRSLARPYHHLNHQVTMK